MSKKNLFHLMTIMIVAMLSIGFTSCGDDEEDNNDKGGAKTTVADPEGTIVANLANDNNLELSYRSSYNSRIKLNSSYNFHVESVTSYGTSEIISVGKVNGLGSIDQLPNGNWSNEVAAIPGNGYIIRQSVYHPSTGFPGSYAWTEKLYLRLYVVEWIKNTSGGIMGCTIKYQEYKPTDN